MNSLLDSGADIDGPIDVAQRTALAFAVKFREIEVVRSLLLRGASQDHLDANGRNAAMRCWAMEPARMGIQTSCLDLYKVLSEHAIPDLKGEDGKGTRVLKDAAAWGGSMEIHELMRLGLTLDLATDSGYNPVQVAVFWGNSPTLRALSEYGILVGCLDTRGRSLLHAVVQGRNRMVPAKRVLNAANHDIITRDLLAQGIDTSILGLMGCKDDVPKSVKGRRVTALEFAAAYGPESEAWYFAILRRCGLLRDDGDAHRLRHLESMGNSAGAHIVDEWDSGRFSGCTDHLEQSGIHRLERHEDRNVMVNAQIMPDHFISHDSDGIDDDDECFWDAAETQAT